MATLNRYTLLIEELSRIELKNNKAIEKNGIKCDFNGEE